MKNYKVVATRIFKDSNEIDEKTGLKIERQVNEEFLCTKERYEFLKANNAVKLVEIIEPKEETIVIDRTAGYFKVEAEDIATKPKVSIEKEVIKNNKKKKTSKK